MSCGPVAPLRPISGRLSASPCPGSARADGSPSAITSCRAHPGASMSSACGGHYGPRASVETQRLFEKGEYTRYLYLHGLSVETAEALAEYSHKKIRQELGIAGDDAERISDLFRQKYRGSRYSFGYPACPNLEDQTNSSRCSSPKRRSESG